jgi:hypothetical protein
MNSFLEIDDQIFKDNINDIYGDKLIYLLGHPKGGKSTFSLGMIKNIEEDNYSIRYFSKTNLDLSGRPIINLYTNKVIGIHKRIENNDQKWYLGTLLKEAREEFNKNDKNKIIYKNEDEMDEIDEITIIYKYKKIKNISEEDIKFAKDVLGETVSGMKIFGENFVKKNQNICKIMINGEEKKLCSYIKELNKNNKNLEI